MGLSRTATPILLVLALGAGSVGAGEPADRRLEIVSRLGRQSVVKIYSGEAVTFRAREMRTGPDSAFSGGAYLYGVTFTLREWPRVEQDAVGIAKGGNRRVVVEKSPGEPLWGAPPSWITIRGGSPGRYRLTAVAPGFAPAAITVHLARFALVDIENELSADHYRASFDVRLEDPEEDGRPVPVRVESLDAAGRVVDRRSDLRLRPVPGHPGEYRLDRRVRISSTAIEGFADRLARRDEDPLPDGFFEETPLRIVAQGTVRISFGTVHAGYPLPLGLPS